jgi:hypothetical protein
LDLCFLAGLVILWGLLDLYYLGVQQMGNTLGSPRCFLVRHKLRRVYKDAFKLLLKMQHVYHRAPAEVPPKVMALVSTMNFIEAELAVARNDYFILCAVLNSESRRVVEAREWLRVLDIELFVAHVAERVPV